MSNNTDYYKQEELNAMMGFLTEKEKEVISRYNARAIHQAYYGGYSEQTKETSNDMKQREGFIGEGIMSQINKEEDKDYKFHTQPARSSGTTAHKFTFSSGEVGTIHTINNPVSMEDSYRPSNNVPLEYPVDNMVICINGNKFYELQKFPTPEYVFLTEDNGEVEVEEWERVTDVKKVMSKDYLEIRGRSMRINGNNFRLRKIKV